MNVTSNILAQGSCTGGATYDGNVFWASWSVTCGPNSKKGTPAFVGPTPPPQFMNGIQPNYHLAASTE
jgi:hypothetical protein